MTIAAIVLSVPLMAMLVGWLYGRHQPDPNTPEGRAYYGQKKETAQ